jgi:hypothetical protein
MSQMSAHHVKTLAAVGTIALLLLPAPAGAAPPRAGVAVPGKTLGGLALGMTPAQVRAAWGPRHGACRGCRAPTWYFNYARF